MESQPVVVATATLLKPANTNLPPGRVRHLFNKLDADANGSLSLEELQSGFEREFEGGLAPHASKAIIELFEKHAKETEKGGKALKVGNFARFYAEILFKHFDTNNDGSLQLSEAKQALKFLIKPMDGVVEEPVLAVPPGAYDEKGELKKPMPFSWFLSYYKAMD
eukprot:CAMPEP_0183332904 /NCGR_PEP_ID=MMETSP0164_2-20130417/1959_1 /TAXON_ID=221442 /ORGANISM="Coccolithus pelagicus ssp braarudi, Strain PLY182g" /LENGTH=164 /DNA_ID=CAMNT_0025501715 /DNA_START=40 /DNA_END=534 /DNA_ORIENTATION=-